jgi:hypothetical protein
VLDSRLWPVSPARPVDLHVGSWCARRWRGGGHRRSRRLEEKGQQAVKVRGGDAEHGFRRPDSLDAVEDPGCLGRLSGSRSREVAYECGEDRGVGEVTGRESLGSGDDSILIMGMGCHGRRKSTNGPMVFGHGTAAFPHRYPEHSS